ncbi:MAG TPA: winged helix-turn-helix domain-containing protein [Steroidobacteraceae bacterium]|nr:winged helix-turn-helix domain-containing protein [Steroidobacteraceae bacterium]
MAGALEFCFGPYRFDAKGRMLFRGTKDLALPPKAADTLHLLLTHAGEVVEKSRLLDTVWANVVVGEGSLTRTISILRKALGGEAASRAYIATVSKRGYRFVAPLDRCSGEDDDPARAMLLVLPFENSSATRPYDWFSDGLTEEMIAQLARLNPQQLGVIARTTSLMFKSSRQRVSEIGRELGVQYVLEGSVRRGRDRVRIAARLIQVSDETQVWAENYERRPGDVLRLQCEVAATIASEIQVKLTPRANPRIEAVPEIPAPAFEALLKGRHFLNQRTESAMRQSISHFETALHHCPDCAQAFAGIADANVMLACRGMVPAKETFRRSADAARRALDIDAELGEAHGSLAHVRLHDWDWVGLEADFRRATALAPSHAIAYYWFAEFLMSQGRPEEAIDCASAAHRLDPLSPVIRSSFGMILYLSRHFDRASEILVNAIENSPQHFLPRMRLGLVRIQQKQFPEAIQLLKTATRLAEESTETQAALAMAYAASGDRAAATRIARKLENARGRKYVLPYNIAKIYAAANDRHRAFDWLETAYEGGNPDLIELNSEPIFDCLRTDRHLAQLMRRIGWNA